MRDQGPQVRDGLHILGAAPEGEQFDGLLAAILRLGARERVPGLRRAIGAAYGLDEPALLEDAGAVVVDAPPALLARFPGPSTSGADLVDRLHDAQRALIAAFGGARLRARDRGAPRAPRSSATRTPAS